MMEVSVTCRSGEMRVIDGETGISLLEAIKNADIDELMALCGGCCSCSTCHVYVDPDQVASLSPMAEDEDELLESSSVRQPNSRLSCQILLEERMAGLNVTIAEQD